MAKDIRDLSDLSVDARRANQGTDRGRELLREALEQCGPGRSIVVDKNGVVINGNKVFEVAQEQGLPIEVVQVQGDELVVVQRTDLDMIEQVKARQMAYYDNRVHEVGLSWSPRQVQQDLLDGVALASSFFPEELDQITDLAPEPAQLGDVLPSVVADHLSGAPAEAGEAVVVDGNAEVKMTAVREKKPPHPTYIVYFDSYLQQLRWTSFMRALREKYPDDKSTASRLSTYLTGLGIGAKA